MQNEDGLLNAKQAAAVIGLNKDYLYKMKEEDARILPYIMTKDGIRYKMSDVLKYKEIREKRNALKSK